MTFPGDRIARALRRLAGGLLFLAGTASAEGIPGPDLLSVLNMTGFWLGEDYDRRDALEPLVESEGIGALYLSDRLVHLDAETLAEEGLFDVLLQIGPHLRQRGVSIRSLDVIEWDGEVYRVSVNGRDYDVFDRGTVEASWQLATETFVRIVNDLLPDGSRDRFYALNAGNDLSGFFLPPEVLPFFDRAQVQASDKPYVPTRRAPLYGAPQSD